LSPLFSLLKELKRGETFASLLNIHGGDIRVVPTHLVFLLFDFWVNRIYLPISRNKYNATTVQYNVHRLILDYDPVTLPCKTFQLYSWWSHILVDETGVPNENHPSSVGHRQNLLHKVE
jgi:hypothetical protein